jgi:hypothetical protein
MKELALMQAEPRELAGFWGLGAVLTSGIKVLEMTAFAYPHVFWRQSASLENPVSTVARPEML